MRRFQPSSQQGANVSRDFLQGKAQNGEQVDHADPGRRGSGAQARSVVHTSMNG